MLGRMTRVAVAGLFGALAVGTPIASVPANAAYSFEWNNAVAHRPPGGFNTCVTTTGAEACYLDYGDQIWVKDTKADGYSAVARWYMRDGRYGTCRNKLGAGKWGVCDKEFDESDLIHYRASRYNGSSGNYVEPESRETTS